MAQEGTPPAKPCSHPNANQFDFWLGTWEAVWEDGGHGSNFVTKILGGCVIQEQFTDDGPDGLVGVSHSTYVPQEGCWKQTWVDNQGSYLDFKGGFEVDRMILTRQTVHEGKPIRQRMVWYDIEPEAFEWSWERSDDDGASWRALWRIHYRRNPELAT